MIVSGLGFARDNTPIAPSTFPGRPCESALERAACRYVRNQDQRHHRPRRIRRRARNAFRPTGRGGRWTGRVRRLRAAPADRWSPAMAGRHPVARRRGISSLGRLAVLSTRPPRRRRPCSARWADVGGERAVVLRHRPLNIWRPRGIGSRIATGAHADGMSRFAVLAVRPRQNRDAQLSARRLPRGGRDEDAAQDLPHPTVRAPRRARAAATSPGVGAGRLAARSGRAPDA